MLNVELNDVAGLSSKYVFFHLESHSLYSYRESLVGTLEAPRGVRQMNGVPQSGADRSATAESRVRVYCSNLFTVPWILPPGPSLATPLFEYMLLFFRKNTRNNFYAKHFFLYYSYCRNHASSLGSA